MRRNIAGPFTVAIMLAAVPRASAVAQSPASDADMARAVERLFGGMLKSDTAAVRGAFLPGGRVIVVPQTGAPANTVNALSVDDFVKFSGNNAVGSWRERFWNPSSQTTGALGVLWFDYIVARGDSVSHCGINSVQMQQTAGGWKIVSMAFTTRRTGCVAPADAKP